MRTVMRCTTVTAGSDSEDNQTLRQGATIIVKTARLQSCLLFVTSSEIMMIMMMMMVIMILGGPKGSRIITSKLCCCAAVTGHMASFLPFSSSLQFSSEW